MLLECPLLRCKNLMHAGNRLLLVLHIGNIGYHVASTESVEWLWFYDDY